LSITYTDAFSELSGSQFDLAIRGGTSGLKDSAYKLRLERRYEVWLTASPTYVAARPPVTAIDDSGDWDWIEFPPGLRLNSFLLDPLPASQRIAPHIAITLDSMMTAEQLALEGFGILAVPREVVEDHVREGRLVRVFPNLRLRPIEMFAIWPTNMSEKNPARQFWSSGWSKCRRVDNAEASCRSFDVTIQLGTLQEYQYWHVSTAQQQQACSELEIDVFCQ
jgi:DNA-binding transcriptional LysR family regulator